MRRTVTTAGVVFELAPFRRLERRELDALQQAAARYGAYLGLEPRLVVS